MATKASVKTLDMTNVKDATRSGINPKRVAEGDYLARIVSVQDAEVKSGDNQGDFQWLFILSPELHPLAKYPYYCKLDANQLWKIRNLLQSCGINVPKKRIKLDPEKVVGKLVAISLQDDEYEGKMKSTIASIFPPSDMEDTESTDDEDEDEDEDEEAPPVRRVKRKAAPEPEEDEDEDEDEEEEPPPVVKKRRKKKTPEPEPEDDEDEDEEEEPAPPKRKKRKAKVTDEELEELDIEDL